MESVIVFWREGGVQEVVGVIQFNSTKHDPTIRQTDKKGYDPNPIQNNPIRTTRTDPSNEQTQTNHLKPRSLQPSSQTPSCTPPSPSASNPLNSKVS